MCLPSGSAQNLLCTFPGQCGRKKPGVLDASVQGNGTFFSKSQLAWEKRARIIAGAGIAIEQLRQPAGDVGRAGTFEQKVSVLPATVLDIQVAG